MENQENLKMLFSEAYQKVLLEDPSDEESKAFVEELLAQLKKTIDDLSEENIKTSLELMHIYSTTMLNVAHMNDTLSLKAAKVADTATEQMTNLQNLIDSPGDQV